VTTLIKLGLILAIIAALIAGMHWYNQGLIEQGKAEVAVEWAEANEEQRAEFEAERAKLEKEKTALAKRYQKEAAARKGAEAVLDKEREDAIRNSAVAAAVCFDERMRDNWDRASGHGGPAAPGEAGRSVAPVVR
jgi:hypothetical protein